MLDEMAAADGAKGLCMKVVQVALAVAFALLAGQAMAQDGTSERPPVLQQQDPRAGISVVVQRMSSGATRVVGQSGRDGAFNGRVRVETGDYKFTAVCPPRRTCSDLRLSGLTVDGQPIVANARGELVFSSRSPSGVVVRAQITCCGTIIIHDGIAARSGAQPVMPVR